jgi:hypothetical protein
MKTKKLKALINTKSNYKNMNNKWVNIIQFLGTIVYCEFEQDNQIIKADFSLTEIKEIKEI